MDADILAHLIKMTPLSWSAAEKEVDRAVRLYQQHNSGLQHLIWKKELICYLAERMKHIAIKLFGIESSEK
jgi:hypothetical protein